MTLYDGIHDDVVRAIGVAGFTLAPNAMKPLSRIDFAKLVNIHDHEEYFLRRTFIDTLIALRKARASTSGDVGKVTADDVETALRMLGTAAARQAEQTLSGETKSLIKDACPFC
ncbi:MAG: hypothetical protein DMF63_00710 [Acidobacteria bacterium]|nr:MAG: hypothetical protein DMF63_00710 [Acidobacteriota bacterium]